MNASSRNTRRTFLKQTGLGLGAAATLGWRPGLNAASVPTGLPPHRPLEVPGLHAYCDPISVAAGNTVTFPVSSSIPYQLSVCRLGTKIDDPEGDLVLHAFPPSPAGVQPIHPGSYVHVERGITGRIEALTLECWVRPWRANALQGVITQHSKHGACEFALVLTPDAGLGFLTGDADGDDPSKPRTVADRRIVPQRWHHAVAVWTGQERQIWLDGEPAGSGSWSGPLKPADPVLRIGAHADGPRAAYFLDADLAMPAVYTRALAPEEIRMRFRDQGLRAPGGKGLAACWPLTEERGDRVADVSGRSRHGRIVNHATWMIGGPSFQAEVPRFGSYDPQKDPGRGHGLRLASDDLYDCRWTPTHRFRIPRSATPGIYVGRFRFEIDGVPRLYHVTFIVRRASARKRAPLLVLCATNTWKAYSGTPFGVNLPSLKQTWGTDGIQNSAGDPPAGCFYRAHAAGQGMFQLGFRMPWPVASPYVLYGEKTDYSHLARADRFLHVWLERNGYPFDVIADHDLHRDPGMLRHYRAFVINGHSEYWSLPMYRGLEGYLNAGGNVVVLSGNSLFWRVSYSEDGSILECRKVDAPGDQMPHERRGEAWHSQDGLRGGMLRECGFPGWRLIGLETLGWNNQGDARQFGPWIVDQPDHFLFNTPARVGVAAGDPLGQAADGDLPRGNGHEIDVRLSTLAALQQQPAPAGATMPSDPPGITRLANGIITWKLGGAAFDYFFRGVKPSTDQGGEMIYWERPEGGRVFNAGSIGTGWALVADARLQVLMRNVLHHFGVRPGADA